MAEKVELKKLVEGMEIQTDESASFLNKDSGEVVTVTDEEFRAAEEEEPAEDMPDWMEEAVAIAKDVLTSDSYLGLPSKHDVHEYQIMERFCRSQREDEIREKLYRGIEGRGAFRRFKDLIHEHDIAEDWYRYRYRDEALKEIATDWCEAHGVEYIADET